MTVTMTPTIANPDLLTESELRVELARMNDAVFKLARELHETRYVANGVSALLSRVVAARMVKDEDAVISVVDDIIEKYVRCQPPSSNGKGH